MAQLLVVTLINKSKAPPQYNSQGDLPHICKCVIYKL
uniref:Uncharacterized protein n=1 Tax=Anguilla anguilla TaxID=7936 RepID=A0A0E9W1X6_ANGAN